MRASATCIRFVLSVANVVRVRGGCAFSLPSNTSFVWKLEVNCSTKGTKAVADDRPLFHSLCFVSSAGGKAARCSNS